MGTIKIIKYVNKFIAYLMIATMLFGLASPMGDLQAASTNISIRALDVTDTYKSGGQYTALMLQFQTKDSLSLPETGMLTPIQGSAELIYNDLDITSVARFRATGIQGVFAIDSLENTAYKFPEALDTISVKGQFALPSGSVIEFPTTTFQYMGLNANGKGYWRTLSVDEIVPINMGTLKLTDPYKNGTSNYSYACVEFQTVENHELPMTEQMQLTSVNGNGKIIYKNQNVTGIANFRVTKGTGVFVIDTLPKNPVASDTITVKGQFKLSEETIIEFPETTFEYMGLNANNKGYWKVSSDAVSISLNVRSLNGTYEYGWGLAIFSPENGRAPEPTGKRPLLADGGTITKTTAATGEVGDITSTAVINSGYADKSGLYYFEGIGAPSKGDIFTIKGRFETEDGFSINFKKTSFQYQGAKVWAPYVEIIDCGDITYKGKNTSVFYFSISNNNIFEEAGGKEVKLRSYNNSGTILKGDVVQSNGSTVDFVYGSDRNCALWGVSSGENVEYIIEGQFALSNDNTKVISFPRTVFRSVKEEGDKYNWVLVPPTITENYVDSGSVTVHSNSTKTSTRKDILYFQTEDTSLPADTSGTGYLRPEIGNALLTYQNPNETAKDLTFSNNIFSYSSGVYIIYLLNNAKDGTIVNLQGKFAMPDGSIGVDIRPVSFQYVEVNSTSGYWVTLGTSFTSDIYWEAENAYEEEILAYEATVRLSKNAKGGVILGTNRDGEDTYAFGVDENGAPYLALKDNGVTVEYKFADVNMRTGNWITMKIVRDGSNVFYYENGELKATLTNQATVSVKPTSKAIVGGNYTTNNANYFTGSIKDVTVYADVACTQRIASYDMSVVASKTNTLPDGNASQNYDITRTLRWLNADEVSVPANYAYSFAVVGDTQAINDKNGNKNQQLQKVYDYIVNNKDTQKIKFVFGLGDITENNDKSEWERAQGQIQKLDAAGIPYSLNRGNHEGPLQGTDSTLMNQYFPVENYKNKLNVYSEGKIENSYQALHVGNVNYLIFSLDYNPSDEVLDWAGNIIEAHPDCNVIITTHGYMTAQTKYTSDAEGGGARVWNNLAKKYSNIVLVLCGHVYANDIAWNQVKGENGNVVTQMVVNPQVADAMTDGGTGMVAMLYFTEDGKNVQIRYYSTVRNQYLADTNQLSLELNVVKHKDAVTIKPYRNVKTDYRQDNNYIAPTLGGYLFAGWFEDEACTKALYKNSVVDDTTIYYAKFVDADTLTVKRQIRGGGTELRLVTTVDSLLYKLVGFHVGVDGGERKSLGTKEVYESLVVAGVNYQPDIISSASRYFVTITINDIPESVVHANSEVTVQPYWVTLDGTMVTGTADTKKMIPADSAVFELVDFIVEVDSDKEPVILQLTDTQIEDPTQYSAPLSEEQKSYYALDRLDENLYDSLTETVEETNPDLILLTGDLVYGMFDDNGSRFVDLIEKMESFGIPWAPVFGNHDNESAKGVDWQCQQLENAENCLFKQGTLTGNGNYTVGIQQGGSLKRVFFMMDSNGCASMKLPNSHSKTTPGFGQDQMDWSIGLARDINKLSPDTKISFAFHIQLYAFKDAYAKYGFTNSDTSSSPINIDKLSNKEEMDFGYLGANLKGAWDLEYVFYNRMKEVGVDSIFVGHEHINSASVVYDGIRFQYGQKTGTYDRSNYIAADGTIHSSYVSYDTPISGGTVMKMSEKDGSFGEAYIYISGEKQ